MSIVINARGTSIPYFKIGKGGTTLYQGYADPSTTYTPVAGDYWFDNNDNSLHVWSAVSSNWVAPTLAEIMFSDNTISVVNDTDLILSTSSTKNIKLNTNSVELGTNATTTSTDNLAQGTGATATLYGQKSFANGNFATAGDAQYSMYILRAETTDATVTELFLDGTGGSQSLLIPTQSVFSFTITISARQLTEPTTGAGYIFNGVIQKDTTAASTAFIGTPSKTIMSETVSEWDTNISVDTATGYLKITVQGTASNTIRWVATVQTTEVTN